MELHELYPDAATAITRYAYDANDHLSRITDAEDNVTTLAHDWAGNRLAIIRGTRSWRYAYDLNSNLLSELSPMPADATPDDYTVRYAYDDLDRVVSVAYTDQRISVVPPAPPPTGDLGGGSTGGRTLYLPLVHNEPGRVQMAGASVHDAHVFLPIAARSVLTRAAGASPLTAATGAPEVVATGATSPPAGASTINLSQAISTIRYLYDQGSNGVGRLTRVELPFGAVAYEYEARGLVAREERTITVNEAAALDVTQWVARAYNAMGLPTTSEWDDGQKWRITYDGRGLVNRVEWSDPQSGDWRQVANYARNLAGLPTERGSSYGQLRTYGYDVLGRPTSDRTLVNGAQVAARGYTYSDSGDLLRVTGETRGESAAASYSYDTQHRLVSATGPNGYSALFSYSSAGNVQTASVAWNGSPQTRNVRYGYGGTDPQAVDLLANPDGSIYAWFAYDEVGNMTFRNTMEGETLLHWDGLDQIRHVKTPSGRETYYYDHQHARLLAINAETGARFWFGESETHYDHSGTQTRRYLHLAAGGPTLARIENGAQVELQYADALQNLMFSLDAAGKVVASFVYGAFGEVVASTGGAEHRRQFNGKESDAISGLRYYGYRYYDPLTLRWSSEDPLYLFVPDLGLSEAQRLNLYTFSLNNPTRYFDADGKDATDNLRQPTRNEVAKLDKQIATIQSLQNSKAPRWVVKAAANHVINQTIETYGIDRGNVKSITYREGTNEFAHRQNRDLDPSEQVMGYTTPERDIYIDPAAFEDASELATTVAHEATHADQYAEAIFDIAIETGGDLQAAKSTLEAEASQAEVDNADELGRTGAETESAKKKVKDEKESLRHREENKETME